RPMVVNVFGAQTLARKLREEKILLVGGVIGSDHPKLAIPGFDIRESLRHHLNRLRPRSRLVAACGTNHRRLQTLRMFDKVERVAALDAQELAVDAAAVPVVAADDLSI